ncbi:hypothetical protein FACS1894216_01780 [Synergistales bacterium]|nr:hypothetical protein FACS1894216_01780 [Synergistales bacterium]
MVPLHAGSPLLSLVGILVFLAGLFLAFTSATSGVPVQAARVRDASPDVSRENLIDGLVSKLELPICITDASGLILNPSAKFCEAIGGSPDDLIGGPITEILPIDDETATFSSGKWWISQVKDGGYFYFSLLPTPNCAPQKQEAQVPQQRGISVLDKDTGLYVEEYRQFRGPQEIERSQRYKRPLSGILAALQLTPSAEVDISDEQKKMVFLAFATKVAQSLRNTDCGFLLPNGNIQLLLPETLGANAKTVMGRIIALPQDAFDEGIRAALSPKVNAGMIFYNGASKMEYSLFSAALEESLQKNSGGKN